MSNAVATRQTESTITFVKQFDARRELVFETFSSPEHLKAWWMPKGCTMFYCTVDFRVGGDWRYGVTIDDAGTEHWVLATYEDIVANERIVFKDYFTDKDGKVLHNLPGKRLTISFDENEAGKTRLTVEAELATPALKEQLTKMGFFQGMTMSLGNLTELLNQLEENEHGNGS